jgi:hypothetical protein
MKALIIVITSCLLFVNTDLLAQTQNYKTKRVDATVPRIDGMLDDKCWEHGIWGANFTQNSPDNGAKPSQETEFKVLYDNNFLYVAVKAYDAEPEKIDIRMARRDGMVGDRIAIEFDSYNDKRTSFMFGVNSAGVKNDGIVTRQDGLPDLTTDFIYDVKTQITNYGWNAEMKIPLSQLRFSKNKEQAWGFQVVRFFFRNQEYDTWQHVPDSISGWVRNYGVLHGISNIEPKRQIEIAPYGLTKIELYEKEVDNPFSDGSDIGFDVGVDGKIGITNDLTLDFAINPDFGQVEADPSNVNLTVFETFYTEKRPFFIEGKNITDFKLNIATSDNLFYSRRIGRVPQGYPLISDGEYVDMPDRTRILGAIKLTGKTQKGWSIGIIENVTNKEVAKIDNDGEQRNETVEPFTNYFLARMQKDINQGNTIIGGIFTSVYRDLENVNEAYLNKSATTAGLDFKQYFKNKKYSLTANIEASRITGSKDAILGQQLSSRRYFQRPDASHLSIDTTLTSLSGHAGTLMFEKMTMNGFNYGGIVSWRSPGFETNDIGYLKKADYIFNDVWAEYIISKPFSIFRRVQLNADISSIWNFGATNNLYSINTYGYIEFKNLWTFEGSLSRNGNNVSNYYLRGGPAMRFDGNFEYLLMMHSSRTKKIRFGAAIVQSL